MFDKNLETLADESLKKAQHKKQRSDVELERWKKEYDLKLDKRIAEHLSQPKLSANEQAAIDEWKRDHG